MKKLILFVAICTSAFTYGQEHREEAKNLSASERASLQTKKLTLALALDKVQSEKVYAVILPQVEKRMEMKAKKKADKGDQKPSKEERIKHINMRLDAQIAFQNEMKNILTTAQFEEFRKMAKKRKMRGKNRGGDRKRGRNMRHKK